MPNKPVLHRRDHEHGGADTVRILWTDEPGGGEPGTGVNDALIHVTWTYLGSIFGFDTLIPDTLEDGTTPGFWHTTTGTAMFCQLTGYWQIDIDATVTHSSTTAPTIVRFVRTGTSPATEDIFSENMADLDSSPLVFSGSYTFAVDDTVSLHVTHAVSSGTPESTMTGTMTFTLIP